MGFVPKNAVKEGIVEESLPSLTFKVRISGVDDLILAHLAGKLRLYNIRVFPGDKVLVEMSDDGRRGRIVRRL